MLEIYENHKNTTQDNEGKTKKELQDKMKR